MAWPVHDGSSQVEALQNAIVSTSVGSHERIVGGDAGQHRQPRCRHSPGFVVAVRRPASFAPFARLLVPCAPESGRPARTSSRPSIIETACNRCRSVAFASCEPTPPSSGGTTVRPASSGVPAPTPPSDQQDVTRPGGSRGKACSTSARQLAAVAGGDFLGGSATSVVRTIAVRKPWALPGVHRPAAACGVAGRPGRPRIPLTSAERTSSAGAA